MFWIIGGDAFFRALSALTGNQTLIQVVDRQTTHVGWDGYVAWDLIFPLFVFITGVTMPFSLSAKLERGVPRRALYGRVVRRCVLLILLGLAPGLLRMDWAHFRPLSVLGLIGVAYFIAAMVVIHRGIRGQAIWMVGLLAGYCTAMFWVPVPNIGSGVITPGGNLAGFIDSHLLPGELYQGVFDPEGLLCALPAGAIALMGVLAGHLLRSAPEPSVRVAAFLAAAGIVSLILGHVWSLWFPIIKALWSSSFILVAGGWSLLLLALLRTPECSEKVLGTSSKSRTDQNR